MTMLQALLSLLVLALIAYIVILAASLRDYPDKELLAEIESWKKENAALKNALVEIRKAQDLLHKQAALMMVEMEKVKGGTTKGR